MAINLVKVSKKKILVSIEVDLLEKLRTICKKKGYSMSSVVEYAIKQALK